MSKLQIKTIYGDVIFEYDCENNTIRKTVEKCIEEKKSLHLADLSSADLSLANLHLADLSSADLSSVNLRFSKNKETAYLPLFCKWDFSIIGNNIQIGCKIKSIEEWDIFFKSEEEFNTKRNTEDFKQIEAVYLGCKAYLTHLKN